MAEIIKIDEAINKINSGDTLMISGFLGVGSPIGIIDALAESNKDELTLVMSVSAYPGVTHDVGKLVANKQVKKFIGAHIGTSKELSKQYLEGELEVEFIPMGTLAECIHAAGAGLGGVLTPVGIGTQQEAENKKVTINGKDYLYYRPIGSEVSIIKGAKADKYGNITTRGTSKSAILAMALAGKTVIAEVNEIVEVGEIEPDDVEVPGILVDYIVQGMNIEESHTYFNELWKSTNVLREE
ncbi:CoA transferase subunit A [Erysipelothrix urinaevulpis]|uniref:CoA transferase subunit A n=1 Tax=Erysipelothrix urinaevulpis TaxID=2683717 RepID=UPI00135B20C3|nr:3-oxoacid CoA-transferase subunit A [Erysipelothrix urinaevulpis]